MDIPDYIQKLWREKRFTELAALFRSIADHRKFLFRKSRQYLNAIKAIKQEFTRLTGRPPYGPQTDPTYWDGQIGKYCEALGVKVLIDDMREACRKYQPNSIIYFLHGRDGKACRWEMLLRQKLEDEIREQKEKDNEAYKALFELVGSPVKEIEPDWVVQARLRLEHLQKLRQLADYQQREDIDREIQQIQFRLSQYDRQKQLYSKK